MNKIFPSVIFLGVLFNVSLILSMKIDEPGKTNTSFEGLPPELQQKIIQHSFENFIEEIFESNIEEQPDKIVRLIKEGLPSWRKSLISVNKSFEETIKDPRFDAELKRAIKVTMTKFFHKYNFYENLKSYFDRTIPTSYTPSPRDRSLYPDLFSTPYIPNRYASVEEDKSMTEDDYLDLFKALVSYTNVYLAELNKNSQKSIYNVLFERSKLETLKGVLFFFLDHPNADINFQNKDNRDTDLHTLARMSYNSFFTKVIAFWLIHPQIKINLKNRQGDTPLHILLNFLLLREPRAPEDDPFVENAVDNIKLFLLHPDIDLTIENRRGESLEDLFRKIKNSNIQALFKEYLKRKEKD